VDANRWLRITQEFEALLAAGPAEQARRLQSLGDTDLELCAAVEALLRGDVLAHEQLAPFHRVLLPTELPDPFGLTGACISHFRVLSPIGAGGMGIVYRAEDMQLGRPVALKFLLPTREPDSRAKERFLREARAIAALDHPNLCTVLEVGETAKGHLFIAMVLYQGETLKARLETQGALPVIDAVRIAQQLSLGLAHAHEAGIIHGDLKPGNTMLLPDGTVKILDFGLVRARDEKPATGDTYGGTVPYMAPEQLSGRPADARTDLWSLGVVLYQMLTGQNPFTGDNDSNIAHAIVFNAPPSMSRARPDAPPAVVALVDRLLRKDPNGRFESAADLEKELKCVAVMMEAGISPPLPQRVARRSLHPVQTRRGVAAALCGLLIVAISTSWFGGASRVKASANRLWFKFVEYGPVLDDRLILVAPFRVTSNDSSVRLLRTGMMDLASAKLSGSIRAVDARAVLNEWHRSGGRDSTDVDRSGLLLIARHFAAGELLDGTIVETSPGFLEISGALIDVSRVSRVLSVRTRGSRRNVGALVDTLVAKLVAARYAGLDETTATLAETPFDALQAYLSGQFAFRRGQYLIAAHAFRRALQIDSTFALAAIRLDLAAAYTDIRLGAGAIAIARAHRDKLGIVERLVVDTDPTEGGLERFVVQEHAIQLAPEVPEFWFNMGENLAHWGLSMGLEDAHKRAIAAFEHALALDSLFTPARHHLLFCYSVLGDTAAVRRVLPMLDSRSEQLSGNLWLASRRRTDLVAFLRDSPRHRVSPWLATPALMLGRLDDLEWAAHYMDSTAATDVDRTYAAGFTRSLALNQGQPARARRVTPNVGVENSSGPSGHELDPMMFTAGGALLEVLLWNADARDAGPALATMHAALTRTISSTSPNVHDAWIMDVFAAAEYGLMRGRLDLARRASVRLKEAIGGDSASKRRARHAALLIDAQLASIEGRPDAVSLANVADSVLRRADSGSEFLDGAGSLLIARVWEHLGNLPRALAASTRISMLAPFYSTFVREHARLSALTGDRYKAISGYREYVWLRSRAEPSEIADLESAKRELNRLLADSTRRQRVQ